MDDQLLHTLSDKELVEVVYNYEKFGYDRSVKESAIKEIESRNISRNEMERLESVVATEKDEGDNLILDEHYLLNRLKFGFISYYITKITLFFVVTLLITLSLLLPALSIVLSLFYCLFFILIEKPFRIYLIYLYQRLREDLYPDDLRVHWLKEIFYIMGGTVIPFFDFYYLHQYRKISKSLILDGQQV